MPSLVVIAEVVGICLLVAGLVLIPLGLWTLSSPLALIVAGFEALAVGLFLVGTTNPELRHRSGMRGR